MSNTIRMNIGFGIVVAILSALAGLSYDSMVVVGTRGNNRQTLLLINSVLSSVTDAETGQRGYLLTGKEEHLKFYANGQGRYQKELQELRQAVQDSPVQLKNVNELEPLVVKKMTALKEAVELRKRDQHRLFLVAVDAGIDSMEGIRRVIARMQAEQDRQLEIVRHTKDTATRNGVMTILFGVVFALLSVILAAFFINYDLRMRRKAEEERDQFFITSLDMLCIAGTDGYFKRLNPAFETVLGYTSAELCAVPLVGFIHPDDVPATQERLTGQANGSKEFSFENRYRCKSGAYRWLSWKAVFRGNAVYAVARDVTDRKRNIEELIAAREAAQKANKVKSQFLANMSHEIRTPLNGIMGMTDLLLETPLSERQQKYAKIVQDSGKSLLALINDILDFSKIEAGKMDLEVIKFNPVNVIEGQADLLSAQASEKGLSLMTYVDPGIPRELVGDPGRISQVLLNLVGNALKFTSTGKVVVRAQPHVTTASELTIRFSVEDTGTGLAPSIQERLFEPFTQADGSTARKFGGTGLGLSICKRLVGLMGGRIGVESEEGKGSTFWFTIPFPSANVAHAPAVTDRRLSDSTLEKLKVLLVDDDPTSSEIIGAYLKSWGMSFVHAKDGLEGLSLLNREALSGAPFGLALIDGRMPGMSGFALADKIHSDHRIAKTPLMLVTAFDHAGLAENAFRTGFSSYLTKPVKQSELLDRIASVVHRGAVHPPMLDSADSLKGPVRTDANSQRILVAEDNSVNQLLILAQLKSLGYSANTVANGKEAIDAIAAMHYDLVLMDCQMPVMDGFEATQVIRQSEQASGRHITIVALTANAMREDHAKCLQHGMDDYASKPLKKEALQILLARWLGRKADAA